MFDRGVAQRFLDAFVDFRGRPPDVKALLRQQGLVDANNSSPAMRA